MSSDVTKVKPSGSAALIIQLSQHRCKGSCMVQMSVMSWIAQLHSKFETARPNLPVRLGRRVLEAPPHNICITLHHHASKALSRCFRQVALPAYHARQHCCHAS
ncbi:hypothetical protein ABBQ38_014706 [Trebouxia sp. C0009 RCD-2024]